MGALALVSWLQLLYRLGRKGLVILAESLSITRYKVNNIVKITPIAINSIVSLFNFNATMCVLDCFLLKVYKNSIFGAMKQAGLDIIYQQLALNVDLQRV